MAWLGPFELLQKLGAGATAEVFLARGPSAGADELLALKVMLPHLAEDEATRRAFLQEGRTSVLLRHPNIVEVFEVGEFEGRAYLAMELVRGWSVSALLKKLKASKETLSAEEGCEIIRQAALGLHFAHEIKGADGQPLGLVHRDVSPQNLIISEAGEVKVADFGLAKATAAHATVTRGLKGKLKYMPPEQLKGEPLDRRSDVFALGAVLWELVTGQGLYPGSSEAEIFQQALFSPQPHPDEVTRGLSRAVVEVLQRSVERQLERRCPTAQALAELLLPLAATAGSVGKISARIQRHFEPLPRGTTAKRRGSPPAATAEQDPRDVPTMASLPPVMDPVTDPQLSANSNPTLPSLRPVDTLHDEGPPSSTFTTPAGLAPRRPLLVPALAVAALAIFVATVAGARYFSRPTFEEVPQPPAAAAAAVATAEPVVEPPPEPTGQPSRAGARPPRKKGAPAPARGVITIDANVPALVSVGDKDYGMTPAKVTLPVGRTRFKVATPDGALATELELTLQSGENGLRKVQLR